MGDERDHTERFTDEELAFLRHARFGEMPPPVMPTEWVETKQTDPAPDEPAEAAVRREWG